jgi:hypothetical protein
MGTNGPEKLQALEAVGVAVPKGGGFPAGLPGWLGSMMQLTVPKNAEVTVAVRLVNVKPVELVKSLMHPVRTVKDCDKDVSWLEVQLPPPPNPICGSIPVALAALPIQRRSNATARKLRIWLNCLISSPRAKICCRSRRMLGTNANEIRHL